MSGEREPGTEPIELEPALQKTILEKERLLSGDHFAVLGLTPDASEEEVRDAYYALSRVFHPDRYFRKNLGSFREKLDRIFRRISEANAVLSDPAKREAYLRANPQLRPVAPQLDPERAAERRSRMARHPYLQKPAHARELVLQSQKLLEAGQTTAAHEALKDAEKFDPRSPEVQKALALVRSRMGQERLSREAAQAERHEASGDVEGALKLYQLAVSAAPTAQLHGKIAQLMLSSGKPPVHARPHAEQAVSMAPSNVEHRVLLAEVLIALGEKRAAKKELEVVLEREPAHARATQLLKKTRGFF